MYLHSNPKNHVRLIYHYYNMYIISLHYYSTIIYLKSTFIVYRNVLYIKVNLNMSIFHTILNFSFIIQNIYTNIHQYTHIHQHLSLLHIYSSITSTPQIIWFDSTLVQKEIQFHKLLLYIWIPFNFAHTPIITLLNGVTPLFCPTFSKHLFIHFNTQVYSIYILLSTQSVSACIKFKHHCPIHLVSKLSPISIYTPPPRPVSQRCGDSPAYVGPGLLVNVEKEIIEITLEEALQINYNVSSPVVHLSLALSSYDNRHSYSTAIEFNLAISLRM